MLEHILSGRPTEEVVNEVHEYLTTMGNDLREGRVELDDLIVHKVSLSIPIRDLADTLIVSSETG